MFKQEHTSFFDKKQEINFFVQKEVELINVRVRRLWHFHNTRKLLKHLVGPHTGHDNGLADAVRDLSVLVDNLAQDLSNAYYDRKKFDEGLDKATELVEMITLLVGESLP